MISLRKTSFKILSGGSFQLHQIGIPLYHPLSYNKYIENKSEQNFSILGRKLGPSEISNVIKFCCERPNGSENIAEKQGARSSWKDLYIGMSVGYLYSPHLVPRTRVDPESNCSDITTTSWVSQKRLVFLRRESPYLLVHNMPSGEQWFLPFWPFGSGVSHHTLPPPGGAGFSCQFNIMT